MLLELHNCCEFDGADPTGDVSRGRNAKLHYFKHGPIQPKTGLVRNAEECAFRAQWYDTVQWLPFSFPC